MSDTAVRTRVYMPSLQTRAIPPGTLPKFAAWYHADCDLLEAVYDYLSALRPIPKQEKETDEEFENREVKRRQWLAALRPAIDACVQAANGVGDERCRLQLSKALWRVHDKLIALANRLSRPHDWIALRDEANAVMGLLNHDDIIDDMRATVISPPHTSQSPHRNTTTKNPPGKDRQRDIIAAIRQKEKPLSAKQIKTALKYGKMGALPHHLAWMVANNYLVHVTGGYWVAGDPRST
jgi:hypothetical protein